MFVYGARNFATGVKKLAPETGASFLAPVSGACVFGITLAATVKCHHHALTQPLSTSLK